MTSQIKKAIHAHTNLNTFHAVVVLLEGGMLYGGMSQGTANRIIALCKAGQSRLLKVYDKAKQQEPHP